jgi:hypothetical protein
VLFFKKKKKNTLYITAVGGSEIVELLLKKRKLGIAHRNGIISRLDGVCRLLEPLLEIPDQLVLARNFL